jgi:hypothetical protein
MRPHRIHLATAALLLVFWASACAGASSQSGSSQQSSQRIQSEHLSTLSAKDFDPTNFDNSTTVDNLSCPLKALNREGQKEADDLQLKALWRNRMDLPRK